MKSGKSYKISAHKLNISFVRSLNREQKQALALILLLKNEHTNSIVYDYNATALSKKLNVSRYHINKLVRLIIANRWGRITKHGHLRLLSFKKIYDGHLNENERKEYSRIGNIDHNSTISDVVDLINFRVLEQNLSQQRYRRIMKCNHIMSKTKGAALGIKDYKALNKALVKYPNLLDGAFVNFEYMGMRRLAHLLNCTLDTARLFLIRLVKRGAVTIKKVCRPVSYIGKLKVRKWDSDVFDGQGGYINEDTYNPIQYLGTAIEVTDANITWSST